VLLKSFDINLIPAYQNSGIKMALFCYVL